MKKISLVILFFVVFSNVNAQDEKDSQDEKEVRKGGFKKENLFVGGSVAVSFGSGQTDLGLSPYFGYSINKWLDAAVTLNFNYISQRDPYGPDKFRITTLGPGAFVRIFPVNFLFVQTQYEHNSISQKYIPGGNFPSEKRKYDANSLLLGAGYASGRGESENGYYYFSISFDVLDEPYSPYVDGYQRKLPVIRAGYNISLFQGKNRYIRH